MRRIRMLFVLVAMVCTVLAGSTSAVDGATGPAISGPGAVAVATVPLGKRWR